MQEKTASLPTEIRAFGGVCTRARYQDTPTWMGKARNGSEVIIMLEEEGWLATAIVGEVHFRPHLHSASYSAALRNLRGHLHNTQISLTEMLRLKGRI